MIKNPNQTDKHNNTHPTGYETNEFSLGFDITILFHSLTLPTLLRTSFCTQTYIAEGYHSCDTFFLKANFSL